MIKGACTVCQSGDIAEAPAIHGYSAARCGHCGHLFVAQGIEARTLDGLYGERYYAAGSEPNAGNVPQGYADYVAASDRRAAGFRSYLVRLERHLPARGDLLDYGCAIGLFVKVAQDAGWRARGYERSEHAAEYGKRVLGVSIDVARSGVEPYPPSSFDAVTLWDTLEHLEQPATTLRDIHRWLRPGGHIALNTVNGSSLGARLAKDAWRHLAPPYHLQYFTRHSLLTLLDREGFEPRAIYSRGTCLSSGSQHATNGGWRSAVDDIIGNWRVRAVATRLNLLDEIEVVAVKKPQHGLPEEARVGRDS